MRHVRLFILVGFTVAATTITLALRPRPVPRASGLLAEGGLVVHQTAPASLPSIRVDPFASVVYLGAEILYDRRSPRVSRPVPDYAALRNAHVPVGVTLKIGPGRWDFDPNGNSSRIISDVAFGLVVDARQGLLNLSELQIEFDCPESQLEQYRAWVETIRKRVHPVPVTITAWPSWVDQRAFKPLLAAADGFVLRLHSVMSGEGREAATPPGPAALKRVIESAGSVGMPFRIGLPTYGYYLAMDTAGRVLNNPSTIPASQPGWITSTLKDLAANRPATLKGVFWSSAAGREAATQPGGTTR